MLLLLLLLAASASQAASSQLEIPQVGLQKMFLLHKNKICDQVY